MYAEERQREIADVVARDGRVSVVELAAAYDVTSETVRRDLSALERAGLVRRVHGGAVPVGVVAERNLSERDSANADQKERIARAAAGLLPPTATTLALDAGSTVARLVALLPRDQRLVLVTHSLTVATRALALGQNGGEASEVHLLPGRVRPTTAAAVGSDTVAAIERLRFDIAFLGTNGLTAEHGLSTPDAEEAATKRALVAAARRVIVLADADKLAEEHLVRFAHLREVDSVVTDDRVSDRDVADLESAGVEVLVA